MSIERIWVRASHTVRKNSQRTSGQVEFIARVPAPEQGASLTERARPAVARRLHVPASSVDIAGLITD
ncbi:hypothetical protein [Paraburkholderia piptadeniae]|uniref:hypothetical protein n=1 Tax=Paraburkholderia piptadeniae TaxID=1701573 RepID=UPI00117DE4A7|nr:hypothetical protein [Paraburkholderia piptadeniae]